MLCSMTTRGCGRTRVNPGKGRGRNRKTRRKIASELKKLNVAVVDQVDPAPFLEATKPGRKTFTDKFGGENYIKEIDAVRDVK